MANNKSNKDRMNDEKGQMSVNEAGRRGGEATSETHGRDFYEEIGHKGGQRVRELIDEGKEAENEGRAGGKRSA